MFTCEYIEYGLVFGINKLYTCCISHNESKGWVPICDYNGEIDLPLDKILDSRKKLKAQSYDKLHFLCQGCGLLTENEIKSDYIFGLINFSHYTFCNLRCDYCYLTKDENSGGNLGKNRTQYDVLPVLKNMINKNQLSPNAKIFWGGGEPTLLPKFDEILNLTLEYGCRVDLNTNGNFKNQAIIDNLTKQNLYIVISIDCGTKELYKKIKKKDLLEKTWENIKDYISINNKNIFIKYIITNENCIEEEAESFCKYLTYYNIKNVIVDIDSCIPLITDKHKLMYKWIKKYLPPNVEQLISAGTGLLSHPNQSLI